MNFSRQAGVFGVFVTSGPRSSSCRLLAIILLPLFALSSTNAQQTLSERDPLHVGFTRYAFRNVNPKDAEAAFLVFTYMMGKQRGYVLDVSTRVFEDLSVLKAEIRKKNLSLIILDSREYLDIEIDSEMEPMFVPMVQGVALREHLLLTRRGSGLNTLADLRGKEITLLNGTSSSIAIAWLETLLLEDGLGTLDAFFRRMDMVTKSSAAVLPVFFGSKQACVVDRLAFESMVEMNPQIGNQLVKVRVSEPYLDSITCLSRHGYVSEQARQDLIDSLAKIHQDPAGRQILTLFKVDQLVPFKEEYMQSVRALCAKLIRLKECAAKQKQAADSIDSAQEGQRMKAVAYNPSNHHE